MYKWFMRRIVRIVFRAYLVLAVVILSLLLVAIGWLFFGVKPPALAQQHSTDAREQQPEISIVLLGTIHNQHRSNAQYSREKLRDIIVAVRPDLILYELPVSDSSMRKLTLADIAPNMVYDTYPELWAVITAAGELDVDLLPFDWPERDEFYRRERYFERTRAALEEMEMWFSHNEMLRKEIAALHGLLDMITSEYREISTNGAPLAINSRGFDAISRCRHSLLHNQIPNVMMTNSDWQKTANELRWLGEVSTRRNKSMAQNILAISERGQAKRVLVITGATHRYALRELLVQSTNVRIEEYWEEN